MDLKDFRYDGSKRLDLSKVATSVGADKARRDEFAELTAQNTARIGLLQDKLYAEGREGLLVVFQAMDAAGKDSTIKRVMSGINPQGVDVTSFKTPSKGELAHDYLWRAYLHLPERGKIAIFNRSYYEDVLVVRVRDMRHGYSMPARTVDMSDDEFFDARYRRISNFEDHLYENGFRVMKFFLNVSLAEQQKRFLERIDDPAKNWKFSSSDLEERALWPAYMDAYERAINGTATKRSPWYVIPADQKWYMRWLVSEAIVAELEDIAPEYPQLPEDQMARLATAKQELLAVEAVEVEVMGKKAAEEHAEKAAEENAEKPAEKPVEKPADADQAPQDEGEAKPAKAEKGKKKAKSKKKK